MSQGLAIVAGSLVAFLVFGNLLIVGASAWARHGAPASPAVAGVGNFQVVDDYLWRGKAPTAEGYRSLAKVGVPTIVDLRAEKSEGTYDQLIADLGFNVVSIPIRDGQSPSAAQVSRFLEAVEESPGIVFVHCGAGVGRTGVMVAAYLVATGQANGWSAMRRNLQVGPPSLEQLAFAAALDGAEVHGSLDRPGPILVALSRTLDAPRRIWHNLGLG